MCGPAAISTYGGPTIGRHFYGVLTHVHHRFDANDTAFAELGSIARLSKIGNLRFLVKVSPYTVSHEISDHRKTALLNHSLHCMGNLAHTITETSRFDPFVHRSFGNVEESLHIGSDASYRHRTAIVADVSVVPRADVDANDIAFAQYAVEKGNHLGGKVVTLSDSGGFIHDPNGIDAEKLAWVMDLKNVRRGRIHEYATHFGCDYHEGQRPWGVPCDLALPCATQNELDGEDAKKLVANGCKGVGEGANMPTTPEGIEALQHGGVTYVPGKAANAGGVACSGLEMSQNSLRLSWTREEVDQKLQGIMANIHGQCVAHGTEGGRVNYVKGANVAGFIKVADAMLAYGVT